MWLGGEITSPANPDSAGEHHPRRGIRIASRMAFFFFFFPTNRRDSRASRKQEYTLRTCTLAQFRKRIFQRVSRGKWRTRLKNWRATNDDDEHYVHVWVYDACRKTIDMCGTCFYATCMGTMVQIRNVPMRCIGDSSRVQRWQACRCPTICSARFSWQRPTLEELRAGCSASLHDPFRRHRLKRFVPARSRVIVVDALAFLKSFFARQQRKPWKIGCSSLVKRSTRLICSMSKSPR